MAKLTKNLKATGTQRRRLTKASIGSSPIDIPRAAPRIVTRSYTRQMISAAAAKIPAMEICKGIAAAKKSTPIVPRPTAATKKPATRARVAQTASVATGDSARSARQRRNVTKKTPAPVMETNTRTHRRRVVVPTKKEIQLKKLRDATKKKLYVLAKHGRKALRDWKKLPDKKALRPKSSK